MKSRRNPPRRAPEMKQTSVSMCQTNLTHAIRRADAMGKLNFSAYVRLLIQADMVTRQRAALENLHIQPCDHARGHHTITLQKSTLAWARSRARAVRCRNLSEYVERLCLLDLVPKIGTDSLEQTRHE